MNIREAILEAATHGSEEFPTGWAIKRKGWGSGIGSQLYHGMDNILRWDEMVKHGGTPHTLCIAELIADDWVVVERFRYRGDPVKE